MCIDDRRWFHDTVADVLFDVEEPYRARFVALLAEWSGKSHWTDGHRPDRHEVVEWLKWRPLRCLRLSRLLGAWTHDERICMR